jgi:predicted nucleotide-binding protein (sugar kinase/HSP70/actin superfamily)
VSDLGITSGEVRKDIEEIEESKRNLDKELDEINAKIAKEMGIIFSREYRTDPLHGKGITVSVNQITMRRVRIIVQRDGKEIAHIVVPARGKAHFERPDERIERR